MEEQVASVCRVLGKWNGWMLVHREESPGFIEIHPLAGTILEGSASNSFLFYCFNYTSDIFFVKKHKTYLK